MLIESEVWRKLFKRGDLYDTEYLSLGNFIYYATMNTLGFLYVNVTNMNYSRRSVMYSRTESRADFIKTICFTPIFFLLSNMILLRSPNDLNGLSQIGSKHTYWECIGWNYGIWTSGYLLGL